MMCQRKSSANIHCAHSQHTADTGSEKFLSMKNPAGSNFTKSLLVLCLFLMDALSGVQ